MNITLLKSNLRMTGDRFTALHGRMATSEQARNWRNFAALAVIAAVIARFA